ncbi:putative R3H and G-patch domain protein [Aspergillus ibericus CBS 121593]|uniref:Protein SQS1 n=1 Tax=Aspergillus ibericus CBS 121593 TaxID=1448316 RepID=A0A395HEM6_9EURO|nr:hypothetical protein BO80DRAFT_343297 [Aspergillus ibericus CBS 121593]RAL06297.1 hypothetical protein BO80DRAFT_343297 [Aspergillus ibericus CBS 121593]
MQQEARNTEGRNLWRTGTSLRHQIVRFVSAQDPQPDQENGHQSPNPAKLVETTQPEVTLDPQHHIELMATLAPEPASENLAPTLCVDSVYNVESTPDSIISTNSPILVDSSEDEVVFRGRKTQQEDRKTPPIKRQTQSNTTAARSPRHKKEDNHIQPVHDSSQFDPDLLPFARDNSIEPHSRTRGDQLGYVSLRAQKQKQNQRKWKRDEDDILADYIENIDDDYLLFNTAEGVTHGQNLQTEGESTVSSGVSDTENVEKDEFDVSRTTLDTFENGFFASATAFADALEFDPYYGFDIMDFNRPSVKKRSKGKSRALDITLSDSELESELVNAWQNDRAKKKARKKQREELRSQGLLGRNRQDPVLKMKYANGIGFEDLKSEIRHFLLSSRNSLALPPMSKQHRKLVHELANALSLSSQSRGKGSSRFPIVHKTSRTPVHTPKTIAQMDRILHKGHGQRGYNPRDLKSSKSSKPRRGRPDASVSYMDGDVVGGSAPEIGAENKGRAMLEKMGWSTGTPLGATNNKGILLPVAHVVKNSRAGLG